MRISRRTFLGFVGGAIVAAQFEYFSKLTPWPGRARVNDICFQVRKTDIVDFIRVGSDLPLLRVGVDPRTHFRWVAVPGEELVFQDGVASLEIRGDLAWCYVSWLDDNDVRHEKMVYGRS